MLLHSYWRSSASFRVRIALNLKGLHYAQVTHHLRDNAQNAEDYLAINPQGLVPALEIGGSVLTQSLAICEYLDEAFPEPPLLPRDLLRRAHVRAAAQVIACDVHPIQNLKILKRLRALGLNSGQVDDWARHVISDGFDALDRLIASEAGDYCFGNAPGLADIFLVPQLANAHRFGVELRWPRLTRIEANCLALPAFANAMPENQPDAE